MGVELLDFMRFRLRLLFVPKDDIVSEPDDKGMHCGFVPRIFGCVEAFNAQRALGKRQSWRESHRSLSKPQNMIPILRFTPTSMASRSPERGGCMGCVHRVVRC